MSSKTQLKLIKSLWGVGEAFNRQSWPNLFARIKSEGYSGVECFRPVWRMPGFKAALDEAGLDLIAQIHTSQTDECAMDGDALQINSFQYITSKDVDTHVSSLARLVEEAKEGGALFVNSHSGCDSWSVDEGRQFLRQAIKIESELGIDVMHETHRRRLFWNPYNYRDVLKNQGDLADVKVNLDISHWVLILERTFGSPESNAENGSDDEAWWNEVQQMLTQNVGFVHARVGYSEGPQVGDPAAPEYQAEVNAHLAYWELVMRAQIARGSNVYVEPEHGPWPYQQSMPGTNMEPSSDIWEANSHVAKLVTQRFNEIVN